MNRDDHVYLDLAPLAPVALGVAAACLATLIYTGAHGGAAPVLAAGFIGAALPFLGFEIRRHGLASPSVLFVVGLAYYHIIVPVEYLIDPALPSSLVDALPSLTEAHLIRPLIAADVALAAFLLGYTVRRDRPLSPDLDLDGLDETRFTRGAVAMIAVGALLYLTMSVVATGSVTGIFHTTYQERDELFYGLGALGFGIDLVYVGFVCLAVLWIARGGFARSLCAVALCAVMGIHSFLVGSKMHVFHVGVGALAGSRAAGRRIGAPVALALAVVLLVPILFIGLARNRQGEGFGAMATFVEDEGEAQSFNPANLDAWGPYLTLVHTTATLRVPEQIRWGATYAQIITLLPPRFLYPDRPRPIDEEFAEEFLGRDYYDNSGFGYSGVTEGYVNGGFVGVAIAFGLFGLGFGAIRDALSRRPGSLYAAILVATAAPWIVLAVREQAAAISKGYGLMTLAPTLAILWYARRRAATP